MHASLQNDAAFDADALCAQYINGQMSLAQLAHTSGANLQALQEISKHQHWERLRRIKATSRIKSAQAFADAQALGAALVSHMLHAVEQKEDFSRQFMPQDETDVKRLREFADTYRLIVHTLSEARPPGSEHSASSAQSAVVVLPSVTQEQADVN